MYAMKYCNKVNWYNCGMEHTDRHLLYARLWVQMLNDYGLVPNREMIDTRVSHGMILGPDGLKMSKSKGNVINPDDIVNEYGADTLRVYEMFIGDYQQDAAWNIDSLRGCKRFLDRIFKLKDSITDSMEYTNEVLVNKTIKKVENDILTLKFNTAISALMIMVNEYEKQDKVSKGDYKVLLTLLNPFAPHITEELNEAIGEKPICESSWPVYDESKIVEDEIEIGVQVNGKVRGTITINKDEDEEVVKQKALEVDNVKKHIDGKEVVKIIVIKGKIVNIVVK